MQREELNFILQYAELSILKDIVHAIQEKYIVDILQSPTQQTLMLPIKDPISGGAFYAGEVLVTTSLICLQKGSTKAQGWAMVLDDNPEISLCIAIIDAYYGLEKDDDITSNICTLATQTKAQKDKAQALKNQAIDSTRVNFELM